MTDVTKTSSSTSSTVTYTVSPSKVTLGGEKVPSPFSEMPTTRGEDGWESAASHAPHPSHDHLLPAWPSNTACCHPFHSGYSRRRTVPRQFNCEECTKWLRSSLSPLRKGLLLQDAEWREWVIVLTGNYSGPGKQKAKSLVKWLKNCKVPVVSEMEVESMLSGEQEESHGQGPEVRDASPEWRKRVERGEDKHGKTAVHVVPYERYTGIEKPHVLVLHWDQKDLHHSDWDDRRRRHNDVFDALKRSHAQLCVCLLSPSPAASSLPLSQEEMKQARRKEQWNLEIQRQLEENSRHEREGGEPLTPEKKERRGGRRRRRCVIL